MLSRRNKLSAVIGGILGAALLLGGAVYGHHRSELRELRLKAEAMTGGDVARGQQAFAAYGCSSCHSIPGVSGATGLVGPPLKGLGSRAIIAGKLENTPDNLQRWIVDPQAVTPGTAMPRLGVKPKTARDISAFLYTQS